MEWCHDGSLIEMAARGAERRKPACGGLPARNGIAPGDDHPIHQAAQADDVLRVGSFSIRAALVNRGDRSGRRCRAVHGSARRAIALLLDRGADIRITASRRGGRGWWAWTFRRSTSRYGARTPMPRRRLRSSTAAAGAWGVRSDDRCMGDLDRVQRCSIKIASIRWRGRMAAPPSSLVRPRRGARWLLDRGSDPRWPNWARKTGVLRCCHRRP
jgi:hypothetical protein